MGKVFSMTQILCQEYFQACMYNSRKFHEDCEGFQGPCHLAPGASHLFVKAEVGK